MKILFTYLGIALCFFLLGSSNSFSQIAITVTNPGNTTPNLSATYSSLSAAITAVNSVTAMSGPVTFSLTSGGTEIAPTGGYVLGSSSLNAVTSSTNTITFQKSGSGANPLITAQVGTTTTTDGIWKIQGTDYVTIDGIGLQESSANNTDTKRMEWGYALVKLSSSTPFDGCQYVTIQNCTITLNKTNTASVGIYLGNHIATSTAALTITATTDAHNYNKFYSNTITNVYTGFYIKGYNASSPYTLYDHNNEIGNTSTTGNRISNYGGASATAYGIYTIYQDGILENYNSITSGTGTTTTLYGIFNSTGTSSSVTITGDTITVYGGGTTSTIYGINNDMGSTSSSNTVTISNNTIKNSTYTTATSGALYLISNTAYPKITNINGNTLYNNSLPGTGGLYGIYNSFSTKGDTVNIYSNTINGNTKTGSGGSVYLLSLSGSSSTAINMYSNSIYDNSKTGTGTSGAFYCSYISTAITINYYSNNIYNNSSTSVGSLFGLNASNSATTENYYNNNIHDLTASGATTGELYGFYVSSSTSGTKTVYGNSIYNLTSSGSVVQGYYGNTGNPYYFYKNKIYGITSNSASGIVYGAYLQPANLYFYNNFISDIKAPSSTDANAVTGLFIGGSSSNSYVYYNTIYLNASGGSTFGSSGIYQKYDKTSTLANNIIVNSSTPGSTSGYTVAFRWSGTYSSGYYNSASNNNCFYAGTPDATHLIFYDGTNADQSMLTYKTRMGTRDAASFSELPPFVNISSTPYDLHLQTTIGTQCESGGKRITSPAITDDRDANIRYGETGYTGTGTAPDVGAHEGNFTVSSAMTFVSSTSTMVTGYAYAGQTNQSIMRISVVTTGSASPLSVSQFLLNANGTTNISDLSSSRVYYSGTSTAFITSYLFGTNASPTIEDFTIDGTQALLPGTNYFWLVYDISSSAIQGNLIDAECNSITVGGVAYTPDSTAPSGYKTILSTMSGTYYVGQGYSFPNFATITDAFSNLSNRGVSGAVNFVLTNSSSVPYNMANGETFPLTLNAVTGASATNTITFKSNTGVTPTITGSSSSSIIKLNGTDYFTLDGSNSGGTDKSLTIENTNTSSNTGTIWLSSGSSAGTGATYNTIKNCNIKTGISGEATTYGIIISGTTISGQGYDNDYNTIQNNYIFKANYGIYSYGNSTSTIDSLKIIGNTIGASEGTTTDYIYCKGIHLYNNTNSVISQNIIRNIISASTSWGCGMYIQSSNYALVTENTIQNINLGYSVNVYGIDLYSSSNASISRNNISNIKNTASSSYGSFGIYAYSSNSSSIFNNLVSLIGGYSVTAMGLYFDGTISGLNIYNNSVYMSGALSYSGATKSSAIFFNKTTLTNIDMRNNIFENTMDNTSYTTDSNFANYSYAPLSSFTYMNFNDYYVTGTQGYLGKIGGVMYNTLSGWQGATLLDYFSVSADPGFTSTTDLSINTSSANCWSIYGGGYPLSTVTTDYAGNSRSTAIISGSTDIGAYEFTPSVASPNLAISGTITDGGISTISYAGKTLSTITWHIGTGLLPTSISAVYNPKVEPPSPSGNYAKEYLEITATDGSGYTYDIVSYYNLARIYKITSESNIRLAKYNEATGWNQYAATPNTTLRNITITGLTSFSSFSYGDANNPLPVEMKSFVSSVLGRDIKLLWITERELNNKGFEVMRSKHGENNFISLGFIKGKGNINSFSEYNFTDHKLSTGKYNYKLKQIDVNGNMNYYSLSNIVEIGVPDKYNLSQNYPNPFNPVTKIDFDLPFDSRVRIVVYDMLGREIKSLVSGEMKQAGYHTIEFNATNIASGIYFYRMIANGQGNDNIFTKKMAIIK
jgi:trimeric autotransporter adhesin